MIVAPKWLRRLVWTLKGNFAFGVAPRPRVFSGVEVAPFFGACQAAVSISADTELNWAFRARAEETRNRLGATERENIPYLLDMFRELSIPITWATVGHLFLESCRRDGPCAHPEMPRPPLNAKWEGDWYRHDPCTDVKRDPLWYAPDLIRLILSSDVPHEVGSHSFSHIDFSPQTSSRELVRREIEASQDAMRRFDLTVKSLVYPFNNMGHAYLDLLAELGIIAVRHRDKRIRLSYPQATSSGVYKIVESMNLRSTSRYNYRDKARMFLECALERTAAYHLWFHPSDPRRLFQTEFYQILKIVRELRDQGAVWVATMRELASYCEARERVRVVPRTEGNTTTLVIQSDLDTHKYGLPLVTLVLAACGMPRTVRQELADANVPGNVSCFTKCGQLLLNVPATNQTVTLSF